MYSQIQKQYANHILKPYLTWYLKKERTDTIKGFKLLIKPTVFHPRYFFSTLFLFDFVNTLELKNKRFFEIGCGSAIISLLAHKKNALVTCSDINDAAIECTLQNFKHNFNETSTNFTCIKSDVFNAIPENKFDCIVINPPYFFEDISTSDQLAWNCGKNGEYFSKLFSKLDKYIHHETEVYMVLAENCDIDRIKKIAGQFKFVLKLGEQKKIKWEMNFIFKIEKD